MKLKDALEEAVADTPVDVPRLVWDARRMGLAHRRRRRALAVVGVAAVVTLAAGVAWLALPGDGSDTAQDPSFVAAPAPVELSGRTGPLTGRGAVAALVASVEAVTQGTNGRYADLRGRAYREPMAQFLFTSDDAPEGLVEVDIQSLDGPIGDYIGSPPYSCDPKIMNECAVTDLPGGDALRTYVDRESGSDPGYERNVAEVISPARGMRLLVSSTTTSLSEKKVVRSEPPLTIDQLSAVATQPWWAVDTLPIEYLEQGEQLESFAPACDLGEGDDPEPGCD